jgi:hypothetical protein
MTCQVMYWFQDGLGRRVEGWRDTTHNPGEGTQKDERDQHPKERRDDRLYVRADETHQVVIAWP